MRLPFQLLPIFRYHGPRGPGCLWCSSRGRWGCDVCRRERFRVRRKPTGWTPASPGKVQRCSKCGAVEVDTREGFCEGCRTTDPLVRRAMAEHAPRLRGAFAAPRLPAQASTAAPGSEERIRELAERAARGEALHHPGDRQDFDHAPRTQAHDPAQRGIELKGGRFLVRVRRKGMPDLRGGSYEHRADAERALADILKRLNTVGAT